ncbi:MAG: SGNH/GDSL hydrolase family protein [Hyphomonadaceae bacterium]|nr:SGNH/GDSL hydrolase family protein [Hyphomonadaceae bacterium]
MKNLALLVATACALAACAHTAGYEIPASSRYVNMGSSFAAGSGTGQAPEGSPARCYQSTVNYAHLLAERLNLALTDVSCAGATSAHILDAWSELPAQIEAVTADTKLVTITVGGNDLAFAGNLTAASCEQGERIHVASLTLPCPSRFPVADDAYTNLERNLREIARQVAARAPSARVVFIQYIALVPDTQCAQSRFTEEEAAELRQVASRLAEITASAARETGASVLQMDQIARGHTPCDSDPWSTGLPRDYDDSLGAPWHPNRRGMEVIANRLADLVSR